MLPTLNELARSLIFTGPLLSSLVCDKFQHLPVELGDDVVITSVGYPLTPYEPLTKCMTSFYPATPETRVQIDCADVETDGSRMDFISRFFVGGSDYLLLANGLSWSEVRSSSSGPVRRLGKPGQVVRVGFFTDAVGRARGFSCTVRGVRAEQGLPCGVRQLPLIDRRRQARILGGTTQDENQWPWMVQVFLTLQGNSSICSGTLITPRYVMTSAHCLPNDNSPVQVVAGALRLGSGVPIASTDYTRHPGYNENRKPMPINDIGVIRLPYAQTYSAAVRPVCLPRAGATDPTRGTAAGWGQTMMGGEPSPLLQAFTMPLEQAAVCNNMINAAGIPNAQVLCAVPRRVGATTCPSDSGGALMSEEDGVFTQVGITYVGEGCMADSSVALFTRVRSFVNFLQGNTDWREP